MNQQIPFQDHKMKKSIEGIICFLVLLVFAACSNNTISDSPTATQTPLQEDSATPISATATATVSSKFMSLLSTETPVVIPTYVTALPITGTPQQTTNEIVSAEEVEIKNVIRSYFDIRYHAFNTLELDGFGDLISNEPEASVFLEEELDKLKINLKYSELHNGRYVAYEYFLDYENISIDPISQRATVSLLLRANVIHEISVMHASGEPIMSSMSGEKHTIILHKEEGEWRIVSDTYNDYSWGMLIEGGTSAEDMLRLFEAQPTSIPTCFTGNQFSTSVPEQTTTPDAATFPSPKIKTVYLNGKSYDPEWLYSFPFTNLYFEPDGESTLRFIVELDDASVNQLASPSTRQANAGWQIVIYRHIGGEKLTNQSALVLDNIQEINCDSRTALLIKTSLEEIQKELGNHRVFDYQVVDENGDIKLKHSFYLNPYSSYLISDTFGDVDRLDGGIIGYPNLIDESKAVFPHEGKVIPVNEPRGGFFQLHYLVRVSRLRLSSGVWTEETSNEVVIQVFLYRDDGIYNVENSYMIPDQRKIRGPKNYDFKVFLTIDELRESLGQGNAFYLRFLDKNGNILGEEYLYFVPYSQLSP